MCLRCLKGGFCCPQVVLSVDAVQFGLDRRAALEIPSGVWGWNGANGSIHKHFKKSYRESLLGRLAAQFVAAGKFLADSSYNN